MVSDNRFDVVYAHFSKLDHKLHVALITRKVFFNGAEVTEILDEILSRVLWKHGEHVRNNDSLSTLVSQSQNVSLQRV